MAVVALSQALRDLDSGKRSPVYVVAGEESFQAAEFMSRLRAKLLKDGEQENFNCDVFDSEHLLPADLIASLDMLPGLFDAPDGVRLVICRRWEKAPAALMERLTEYLGNPSPSTSLLLVAEKIDKRKAWVKEAERVGTVIEVAEPYDRDWPKWRGFFEKRCGKSIDANAWDILVEAGMHRLGLVASECEKAAVYVGEKTEITVADVLQLCGRSASEDIFELSEDIVGRRPLPAMVKLHHLLGAGESEIKILSIVLRHFRQVVQCRLLMESGVRDSKVIGQQIGIPPFFVPKIQRFAAQYDTESLSQVIHRLSECDYLLKRGEGTLWGDFLVGHFESSSAN